MNISTTSPLPDPSTGAIHGCLLGSAVGDAIGLPYEGMSMRRAQKRALLPLRHRFVLGKGMVSDDTDHSVFVAQALIRSRGDVAKFRSVLAWRLRLWLLCLPAGIGWATLRGIVRLWFGIANSGVYSAGNGPSMRSAIIGATFASDAAARRAHVAASTRLTHTDPKALAGALAIAEVAARITAGTWTTKPSIEELIGVLRAVSEDHDWQTSVKQIRNVCSADDPVAGGRNVFGSKNGVSGYVLHSVPFALVVWFHHFGDYRATIESVTQAGGDVDTIAAIAGALAGATAKVEGIPENWTNDLADWPHSKMYLRELSCGLTDDAASVSTHFSPWLIPRGVLFTVIVLLHGVRRLLPPY